MPTPKLPPESFQRHFPAFGKGNPIIESDGDCLIIRRVMMNGKNYDFRIWRFDANDALIRLNKDSSFLKEVIQNVQELAVKLFEGDNFQDPTKMRMWFSDKIPTSPSCRSEQKSLPDGHKDKYTPIAQDEFPQIYDTMEQIHHSFFHGVTTVITSDQDHTLFPKMVRKEEDAEEQIEGASPIEKGNKNAVSTFPENIVINLPPPMVDAAASTDSTGSTTATTAPATTSAGTVTPEGQTHVATLRQELDATSRAGTGVFEDVTYTALENYARSQTGDATKLKPAYEVYQAVLKNPQVTGKHTDDMREWLRKHYLTAYNRYKKLQRVYDNDADKKSRDFEQWCKYYAAKAVAGFILVNKEPIQPLVDLLVATAIPTATPTAPTAPAKKGWSLRHPFTFS